MATRALTFPNKHPSDDLPYAFGFADVLAGLDGDTIASATVTATGTGLTVGEPSIDGGDVLVRLSAGTSGTTYTLTCVATMASGYDATLVATLYVTTTP